MLTNVRGFRNSSVIFFAAGLLMFTGCSNDSSGVDSGNTTVEITSKCTGVRHGSGKSYVDACVKFTAGNYQDTDKITFYFKGAPYSDVRPVDEQTEQCFTATIYSYGAYAWEIQINQNGEAASWTGDTAIVGASEQECIWVGP